MDNNKYPNPFTGVKGFWGAVNRFFYPIAGPAHVGIGRDEAPYVAPANPSCPLCHAAMSDHVIERGAGTTPTRLHCPVTTGVTTPRG